MPPRAAFQSRDFRLYQVARFLLVVGLQMQSMAIGWYVYARTHSTVSLAFVGLAQFAPAILLALVTGMVADRFDRRGVLVVCYTAVAGCAGALALLSQRPELPIWPIYGVLVVLGTARAFAGPAAQSLVPHLVPAEHFPNAVSWASSVFQIGTITGPVVGGVIYGAAGATVVFMTCAGALGLGTLAVLMMHVRTGRMSQSRASWSTLSAGMRYVWAKKTILGSISMDLFAVLLGGATALLPVYAHDILHVGPWGLGILRSAPAIGAATMAVVLAYRPLQRRTGAIMLGCVGLFGFATIVFGLSRSFWLSMVALTVLGASDQVSVVTRLTLVQVQTPPEMRGRVAAVNMIFIGASNELGEFESGITADAFGVVRAVVLGGIGTLVVVALWTWWFPELRKLDRVDRVTAT